MLEGDIHVAAHLWIGGHLIQYILREICGVGVMDAEPLYAVHLGKLPQELCQGAFSVNIKAVISGILGNDNKLPYTLSGKFTGLCHQGLNGDGFVRATYKGNGAV